jgi:hypothetical protein
MLISFVALQWDARLSILDKKNMRFMMLFVNGYFAEHNKGNADGDDDIF